MEPFEKTNNAPIKISRLFMITGISALILALIFGLIAAFQFVVPSFLPDLPFYKARPLHVSLAVAWIFCIGIGATYNYLEEKKLVRFRILGLIHWIIFITTGLIIIASFFLGVFGGREYWEFPPIFSIPILVSWIFFGAAFFTSISKLKNWPIYMWMWSTGILVFFFTFLEANSWILNYFSTSVVRELTIQWKSYGSLVGSWNMFVYGAGLFLLEKISGSDLYSRFKIAFVLYFVGLTNLFFNWAHHVYAVPSSEWIGMCAYIVSMTELFIIGRIIWKWKSTLSDAIKFKFNQAYIFILASDIWIFFNLALAIIISVPAINLYTHGTHITVAHAMGSTIGINTMILIAFLLLTLKTKKSLWISISYYFINSSLFVFWCSLIFAGILKSGAAMHGESFQIMMNKILPVLEVFSYSGLLLAIGILILLFHLIFDFLEDFPENLR